MAASLFCGLIVLLHDVQTLISLGVWEVFNRQSELSVDSRFAGDMCQLDTSIPFNGMFLSYYYYAWNPIGYVYEPLYLLCL